MSKKEDLKLAAKVAKKQKRREEKEAKKLEKEKSKDAKKKEREREREREKEREEKSLKKQEKKEKKKQEKDQKKKLKKEQKEQQKIHFENAPKAPSGDKEALQFLATFGEKVKKEKKRSEEARSEKKKSEGKKPKLSYVSKIAFIPQKTQVSAAQDRSSIPTPVATPQPKEPVPIKPVNTKPSVTTESLVTTKPSVTTESLVRKPVGIRTPGANREINPIYTRPVPMASAASTVSDFTIPGVNDTEEARILTRTFADKWILPANLYKIEANTGLKYRRGRFSDAEKILAMKLTTKFCQEQNMSLERFKTVFFDDMGTENGHQNRLSNFFVDVSQHFGGRPVVAVYDFLKRLYHPGNHRGPWTPEEDQVLLREFQKHGPKWTLIGKELNRLGINCRDRYNIRWKHEGKVVNGPWSEEEDGKLVNAIKDSLEASGTISWLWISEERVKTRTPLQCLIRWKIINKGNGVTNGNLLANIKKRTVPKVPKAASWNGWKEDEDYLLIHAILTSGAVSDESIQWKDLKVQGIPEARHNPELFFRRWNHLKIKAEIADEADLKETVEKVKKYLIKQSKSPAYIFSEDEEDIFWINKH